jgi:uncharacterized protein
MEDLTPGMALEGVVTNVTAFGAFVDVGVHQDGLVHVSQLSDRFIKDPNEVVKVGDKIKVRVIEVDLSRKRISLTAKSEGAQAKRPAPGEAQQRGPGGPRDPQGGGPRGPQGGGPRGGGRPNQGPQKQEGPKFSNNPFANLLKR